LKAAREDDVETSDGKKEGERQRQKSGKSDDKDKGKNKSRPRERSDGNSSASGRRRPPVVERGYSDSFYANDNEQERAVAASQPQHRSSRPRPQMYSHGVEESELLRRNSDSDVRSLQTVHRNRRPLVPGTSSRQHVYRPESDMDMDLAYGELPPPLPPRRYSEEGLLRLKMTALNRLLEEANCVHHTATTIIKSLESNPEAMAAVALALAEISNLMTKMAPGALMGMKGAFPAIVALLLSPEFLIAVGVGLGVTVVALGGYKIVKRIKRARLVRDKEGREVEEEVDELEDVTEDVNKVEGWRRGLPTGFAEEEGLNDARSVSGTSVEGEWATPAAGALLRERKSLMAPDGKEEDGKIWRKSGKEKEREKKGMAVKEKTRSRQGGREKEASGLMMLFKKKEKDQMLA